MKKTIGQIIGEIDEFIKDTYQGREIISPSRFLANIGPIRILPSVLIQSPVLQSAIYAQAEAERYLYELAQLSGEPVDKLKELILTKASISYLSVAESAEFCFKYYQRKGELPEIKAGI